MERVLNSSSKTSKPCSADGDPANDIIVQFAGLYRVKSTMAYFWCLFGALLLSEVTDGFTGIRLRGGKHRFEGRVEVEHEGEWRGICDHGWDKVAADVVCRMLGFPGALRYYKG